MRQFKKQLKESSDKAEKSVSQAIIEYILVLLMIAVVMTLMFKTVGQWSNGVFGKITSSIINSGGNDTR